MKVIFFLAVFALITQVHNSEVTEFYRTFVNNIPTDAQARNKILNDGLECLNFATKAFTNSFGKIQKDLDSKDMNNLMRDVVGLLELFQNTFHPKCNQALLELRSSLVMHAHNENFYPRLLAQIMAKTVLSSGSNVVVKDLATLRDIASRPIDAPSTIQLDPSKFVRVEKEKAYPLIVKGLLNGFGVYDPIKVKGTSECLLDGMNIFESVLYSDPNARNNVLSNSLGPFTKAFEKCQRLDIFEMTHFKKLLTMYKESPDVSLMRVFVNFALGLPNIMATMTNTQVYQSQGQFEQAGQLYAKYFKTLFDVI